MPNAILLPAAAAEAPRAARWLGARLADRGCAADSAARLAARLERAWGELSAALFPRGGRAQILLSVRGEGGTVAVELAAELSGRLPAPVRARAAALGLEPVPAPDGVQPFRLAP